MLGCAERPRTIVPVISKYAAVPPGKRAGIAARKRPSLSAGDKGAVSILVSAAGHSAAAFKATAAPSQGECATATGTGARSEEHTSELQSLLRISYAVFRLKKKTQSPNART